MNRHWGSDDAGTLRVARLVDGTAVLGPGRRAVVLVQGCRLRCRGCIAEETHPIDGGEALAVERLASWLDSRPSVSGVTFSGGEPFLQAAALSRLIDLVRARRPELSTMSYSGYRLEWLREKGSESQRRLLRRLDILVDGPYVRRLHGALRWRGSSNQRVHALSPRHRTEVEAGDDRPAGMEWSIDAELNLEWVGVPPLADFAERLAGQPGVPLDRQPKEA